jgi:FkbM family methyltransferase
VTIGTHTLTMRTPRGTTVTMEVRPDTCDHNNVWSACQEDEYGLASVDLGDGWALDIGAHIGGVTVPLAVDNPRARIIAVEALSENVAVLQRNVEAAGVADRVTVLHAIANRPGIASGVVRWNFRGGEAATHHRYIGNAQRIPVDAQDEETVDCVSLADLLAMAGGAVDFVKIDCEGGEYDVLADPVVVQKVREYRGEHHAGLEGIVDLLGASHHVTLTGGVEAFGAFRAVAR